MSNATYVKLELPENPVDIIKTGFYELPRGRDRNPARVQYYSNYLEKYEADELLKYLQHELPWQQREGFNKNNESYKEPRLTCWYGLPYTYSKVIWKGNNEWNSKLLELHERVSHTTNVQFNSVMCNLYRTGRDSIGWHSDDEPSLGRYATISSVSLGSVRPFEVCLKSDRRPGAKPRARFRFLLNHGSLLIMEGSMQENWLHSVPKDFYDKNSRINLTFRVIKNPDDGSGLSLPKTPDIRKYMMNMERTHPDIKFDLRERIRSTGRDSPTHLERKKVKPIGFINDNSRNDSSNVHITDFFPKDPPKVQMTDYLHREIKNERQEPTTKPCIVFHQKDISYENTIRSRSPIFQKSHESSDSDSYKSPSPKRRKEHYSQKSRNLEKKPGESKSSANYSCSQLNRECSSLRTETPKIRNYDQSEDKQRHYKNDLLDDKLSDSPSSNSLKRKSKSSKKETLQKTRDIKLKSSKHSNSSPETPRHESRDSKYSDEEVHCETTQSRRGSNYDKEYDEPKSTRKKKHKERKAVSKQSFKKRSSSSESRSPSDKRRQLSDCDKNKDKKRFRKSESHENNEENQEKSSREIHRDSDIMFDRNCNSPLSHSSLRDKEPDRNVQKETTKNIDSNNDENRKRQKKKKKDKKRDHKHKHKKKSLKKDKKRRS